MATNDLAAAIGEAALKVKVQISVAVRLAYTESGRVVSLPLISKMSKSGYVINNDIYWENNSLKLLTFNGRECGANFG